MQGFGPEASYTTAVAARKVCVQDRMGLVQTSHGDHCAFREMEELRAFCTRFLLDGEANPDVFDTDGLFDRDRSKWIPWNAPDLNQRSDD